MNSLQSVRIILVETSLSANIGSVCRAMKTMGLYNLVLVRPHCEVITPESLALASGADDVLHDAQVVSTLPGALDGCHWILGASARSRSFPWPLVTPRAAAEQAVDRINNNGQTVAVLLGRERSGLTNEELALCHLHVNIPANPDYSSLNLAAATQVLSYEMRMAALAASETAEMGANRETALADGAQMEGLFTHLQQTLVDIGYLDPDNPKLLMTRLRRLLLRAEPDTTEVNILRGILKQTLKQTRNGQPLQKDE